MQMLKDRTQKKTFISNIFRRESTRYNEEAERFHAWLVAHVTRRPDIQGEQAYRQESAAQLYRGKYIQQFAPFRAAQSAYQTWTPGQIVLLSVFAATVIVSIIFTGISTLTAIFSIVTLFYLALLGLSVAWLMGVTHKAPTTPFSLRTIDELKHAPWPSYTILCPLYKEKAVVPQFVEAIRALDYPTDCLQVLFLTEADDEETRQAILALRLPAHFQILVVPPGSPKTKPRACNYGLLYTTGEYVVIFDAEDIPDPRQLKKAVLTFASSDPTVACVQAKLNFYNPAQNLLTRWFTIEYTLWFGLILPGLQRLGFSLPLGGTSNHFRTSALRHVGAWDAFNVTEDCDLGLKLTQYGLQTVVLDSTTMEEANSRPISWIKQRSRWIKGYMQTYLVHTRHPLEMVKQGKIKDLLSLHLFVGVGSIILLVNPIMWAMFAIYLIWRPVALYHQLFPWPVLYGGMLCFLAGNFLPIYASMIACVRRDQYALVKWCLLLPLYWILASAAAILAAYELIRKPHHWHKTQHGLHLKGRSTEKALTVSEHATQIAKNIQGPIAVAQVITEPIRAMSTVLTPAVSALKQKRTKARDPWLILTLAIACICSVAATAYFFAHHEILLYGDAYSHLRIARSVFDSITPGLAQLGGVWLPLPHILMFPFIWNDYLWHSGLAGSFVSMPCYVVTSVYLYRSIYLLTERGALSWAGTSLFLFNPNVLYLQATPLSEMTCTLTLTMACYYFLKWIQTRSLQPLIFAAISTFLATLARYDGWALFVCLLPLIVIVGLYRREKFRTIESQLILFAVPGGSGIVLWFIWNKLIFGDFLYFQHGSFSSQVSQMGFLQSKTLYSYHNIWESFRFYSINSLESVGTIAFILACVGCIALLIQRRYSPPILGTLAFLVPFVFYIVSLYEGQAIIWVPFAVPASANVQLFNVRYGSEMVVPVALFTAYLFYRIGGWFRLRRPLAVSVALLVIVIAQSVAIASMGIITLQDGQYGLSCTTTHLVNAYLAQHYNGGRILDDVIVGDFSETETGLDFKTIVYDGSGALWNQALQSPSSVVDWIIADPPAGNDRVSHTINLNSAAFRSQFDLVVQEPGGLQLYHRAGLAPLPTRNFPSGILTDHRLCLIGSGSK